jgi:hypothetical protein
VRALSVALLVAAACGGKPSSQAQGRPEDVAKAVFEALKAGGIDPLEPHLLTAEEAKRLTGVALDDSAERERWSHRFAQHNERLGVDWATAALGRTRVRVDSMGAGARVSAEIVSETGTVALDVAVTKVGARWVFQDVKVAKGDAPKQAAPAGEEDGCGED